jgi:predicted RNA-binding protein with RPS1 domain
MSEKVETVAEQEEAARVESDESTPVVEPTSMEAQPVAQVDAGEALAEEAQADETPEVAVEAAATPVAAAGAEAPAAPAVPEAMAAEAEETSVIAAEVEAAPAAQAEAEALVAEEAIEQKPDDGGPKVRVLSTGQQVTGTVKRVADFGAFVDIGVGRDGLIHISELSVRRVGKVTDVLSEGQEVTAWIKKLDRERNRISLTLIDPETKTIRDIEKGDLVQGTVTRILPYGAFVDIGIGRDALLHVREMADGYVAKPEDVVKAGDEIETRVIEVSRRRGRVDLSLKGLRPEPEAPHEAPAAVAETPVAVEDDDEVVDAFEDVEVLSPMELAFKRAMEAEGMEISVTSKKKQGKRGRRERSRTIQDEIIARTLSSSQK